MTVHGRHQGRASADVVAIAALAAGATAADAAIAAGLSERSVRRRLADREFRARIDEVRCEMLDRVVAQVSVAATGALDTLALLLGEEHPDSVRLGAAKTILDAGIKLRAELDLGSRMRAVEVHLGMVDPT